MINDIIKSKKLNIRKLSECTGMPYTTLYEYVSGKRDYRQMSAKYFNELAEALGLSMDELWDEWDTTQKTDTTDNFVLNPGTEVLYRLHKRKNDYIMYVKLGDKWVRCQKNYPKGLPEDFYPDYYNMTANKIYYDALCAKRLKN